MKRDGNKIKESEIQISLADFLKSYNQNMPASFPRASTALLRKFQGAHTALFKNGDRWSLDQHRKKFMDWLPRNNELQK